MKKLGVLLTIFAAVGSLTVVNRVEPYILGLPFIVFWTASWLVITSACLYISSVLHERKGEKRNE